MDHSMQDDLGVLQFLSSFSASKIKETWKPPKRGWWKVNCDTAWVNGKATMAMVVWDEDGLLVMACSKVSSASSAYEAEMKTVEWAVTSAARKPWNKLMFSSSALTVVNEMKSSNDPNGWYMKESVFSIRAMLNSKGWELYWNARSSNFFADCLVKSTLAISCNFLFPSSNLGNLPKDLSDTYVLDLSDLMGSSFV